MLSPMLVNSVNYFQYFKVEDLNRMSEYGSEL